MNHTFENFEKLVSTARPFSVFRYSAKLHEEGTGFLKNLWPSNQLPFHPLNPVFLSLIKDLDQLKYLRLAWVWDGAFPLVDFFSRFPEPDSGEYKLLINANLAYLVPDDWKSHVLHFRMKDTTLPETKETVVYGLCNKMFLSWPVLEKNLETILPKWSLDNELYLALWKRNDPLKDWFEPEPVELKLVSRITESAKSRPRFLEEWKDLKMLTEAKAPKLIHLDLFCQSLGFCSVEYEWRFRNLPVEEKPSYLGLKAKKVGEWELFPNQVLEILTPDENSSELNSLLDKASFGLTSWQSDFYFRNTMTELVMEKFL